MSKRILVPILFVFCLVSLSHAGPVAHWSFDDGSGTQVNDVIGAHNGTLVNGAYFTPVAKIGSHSAYFDGVDDYAEFPDDEDFNPGNGDFSYAFWIRPYALPGSSTNKDWILNKRNPAGGEWISVILSTGNIIQLNVLDTDGGVANQTLNGTTALETFTWYHVAVVIKRDSAKSKIYINGLDDTAPSAVTFPSTGNLSISGPVHLGRWSGSSFAYNLKACLDDFRVFDHALSQAEVQGLMDVLSQAVSPTPSDGSILIPQEQILSWEKMNGAIEQYLYINFNDPDFSGIIPITLSDATENYNPGGLACGTYYWRIDSVDGIGTVHQGQLWSFTTAKVADFRDDFQNPTPLPGWRYMWNSPSGWPAAPDYSTGSICDFDTYAQLHTSGSTYTPDGDSDFLNNPPAGSLVLNSTGGHPGNAGVSTETGRYAIAAYTVDRDGYYKISDSFIRATDSLSDGIDLLIRAEEKSTALHLKSLSPNKEHCFDTYMGFLKAGQAIYVAVGPGADADNDAFEMNFSVEMYDPVIKVRYSDSFAGEDEGWGYAWNQPDGWVPDGTTGDLTTGNLEDVSSHVEMIWTDPRYTPDGDQIYSNNSPAGALQLYSTGGHPGQAGGSGEPDRYAIATFKVSVAGDYQIGHAWLESVSQFGTGLELIVMVNGQEILTKNVEGATYERFECRLGHLELNDTIQVAVGPDGNSAYDTFEWDFEISLVDPYFADNSVTLHISDFGAIGDGITDDGQAINNAIEYAESLAEPVTIVFDGAKTYRIESGVDTDGTGHEYALGLFGANQIHLKGNGATLSIKYPVKMAYVTHAEDILIEGLNIEYDPLPYFQATIESFNANDATIDVKVQPQYPMPPLDDPEVIDNMDTWQYGRLWGNELLGTNGSQNGSHFWIKTVKEIDPASTAQRIIRVTAQGENQSDGNWTTISTHLVDNITDTYEGIIIANPGYGQVGGSVFRIWKSSRVKIKDTLINSSPHMIFHINGCSGPVSFNNVDILVKATTERFVSWRDGFHTKNNAYGVLWEDCDLDGWAMYDDLWNLTALKAEIETIDPNDSTKITARFAEWPYSSLKPGYWTVCQNFATGSILGAARVLSVVNSGRNMILELDREIPGMTTDMYLYNQEFSNRATVIRRCRSYNGDSGFSTVRLRTPTLFEDNDFDGLYMIIQAEDIIEAPLPRDIVFRRNHLVPGRPNGDLLGIGFTGSSRGAAREIIFEENLLDGYVSSKNAIDISFINNNFVHPDKALVLYNSGPVTLAGNLFNGSLPSSINDWISWDGDTNPATDILELSDMPPRVHIISPQLGTECTEPCSVDVTVEAFDADGSVANVKLYINGQYVGADSISPYMWPGSSPLLNNLSKGRYRLTAVATDNDGLTSETTNWLLVADDWPLAADYSLDGKINLLDLAMLASDWLGANGKSLQDLAVMADSWLEMSNCCTAD